MEMLPLGAKRGTSVATPDNIFARLPQRRHVWRPDATSGPDASQLSKAVKACVRELNPRAVRTLESTKLTLGSKKGPEVYPRNRTRFRGRTFDRQGSAHHPMPTSIGVPTNHRGHWRQAGFSRGTGGNRTHCDAVPS